MRSIAPLPFVLIQAALLPKLGPTPRFSSPTEYTGSERECGRYVMVRPGMSDRVHYAVSAKGPLAYIE